MKSKNILSLALVTFTVLMGALAPSAHAASNYTVTVSAASQMQRYIPSAMFNAVEIAVNNGGIYQTVWYYQSSAALDPISMAMITTPKATFVDMQLQCTNDVPVTGAQQVFYAGSGQNCNIQIDAQ